MPTPSPVWIAQHRNSTFDGILADNQRIAVAITRCIAEIEGIGQPELLTTPGYDFADVLSMLREIRPTCDRAAITAHVDALEVV